METLILDHAAIQARIKRIAYQVYERNYEEKDLIVLGLGERGYFLAKALVLAMQPLTPLNLHLFSVEVDRSKTTGSMEIYTELRASEVKDKPVLVIDDVLYSGRTLLSVVAKVLMGEPRTIQTFVLIDRGHRAMPISPDFVGEELATSLQQHVSFEIEENGEAKAYLR
ncbi:MAG: phosphoribosyltransferase family protein [Bacteroidia bacterium]